LARTTRGTLAPGIAIIASVWGCAFSRSQRPAKMGSRGKRYEAQICWRAV